METPKVSYGEIRCLSPSAAATEYHRLGLYNKPLLSIVLEAGAVRFRVW